jgi:hypothetical protein
MRSKQPLRALILQNSARITVSAEPARWERLIEQWRGDVKVPRLALSIGGRVMPNEEYSLVAAGNHFA